MNADSHSFNVQLASLVGLQEAIILQHFHYWHQRATHLPEMHREGRVWFFRSVAEMRQVFPYLSDANVRTAIQHLLDRGLIVKGDFAATSMNKATWYSLTDGARALFADSANPFGDSTNGFVDSAKCIDNSKSNRKDNKKNNNISSFDFRSALLGLGVTPETADTWMEVRRRHKAVNSEIAFKDLCTEIAKSGQPAEECVRIAAVNSWRGFRAEYLRPRNLVGGRPQGQQQRGSVYANNARTLASFQQNNLQFDEQ